MPTRALAVIVVTVAALALARGAPASPAVDLTGDWSFRIDGDFGIFNDLTLHCTAPLEQNGDEVSAGFECGVANGSLTATLTPQTQGATIDADVHLDLSSPFQDIDAHVTGTVAPHGNYMDGDWEAPDQDAEGTFEATRDVAQFLNGDLNCDAAIDALDPLTAMLHTVDATVSQQPGCPEVGSEFALTFGDLNCDDDADLLDALWLLRHLGGVPLATIAGCPEVGELIVKSD